MLSGKMKYIGANIIAPGIGQLTMKKWFRGSVQLLGAILCVVWMLVAFVEIIIDNYYRIMNGTEMHTGLSAVFTPIGVLILWWIYSYIDLIFFCSPPPPKKEADNYQI